MAEQKAPSLRERKMLAMELDDITYAIRGAVFEVNRVLGSGFLEKVYENALCIELREKGLKAGPFKSRV